MVLMLLPLSFFSVHFFLLSAFPTVADSVQAALQEYQAAGERVKDLKVAVVSVVLCWMYFCV